MPTPPFDIRTITRKHAPLVRFHPEEGYFTSSVEWYLKRVELWHVSSQLHARRPTQFTRVLKKNQVNRTSLAAQKVGSDRSDNPRPTRRNGIFYLDIPSDTNRTGTCIGHLSTAKCYAHVQRAKQQGRWWLAYLFLYPFNGSITADRNICHEGDWEHVKVEVDSTGERVYRVWFAAHEGGKWHRRYSTAAGNTGGYRCHDNTHPIVYSARHSHASYPRPGRQPRSTIILPDDYTGNGREWRCWENLIILGDKANPKPNQDWLKFCGRWGELRGHILGDAVRGPTGPGFKDWWKDNGFDSAGG